jgi:hypothetical protein
MMAYFRSASGLTCDSEVWACEFLLKDICRDFQTCPWRWQALSWGRKCVFPSVELRAVADGEICMELFSLPQVSGPCCPWGLRIALWWSQAADLRGFMP